MTPAPEKGWAWPILVYGLTMFVLVAIAFPGPLVQVLIYVQWLGTIIVGGFANMFQVLGHDFANVWQLVMEVL